MTTVGPVRECSLAYDSKGKSKGISTVIFNRKGDAQKAFDMCKFLRRAEGVCAPHADLPADRQLADDRCSLVPSLLDFAD